MFQKVNIRVSTTAVTMTTLTKWIRELIQVLTGLGLAIPLILKTPEVAGSAVLVKDLGIAGGVIATVLTIVAILENTGTIPVFGAKPAKEIETIVAPKPEVVSVATLINPKEVPDLP